MVRVWFFSVALYRPGKCLILSKIISVFNSSSGLVVHLKLFVQKARERSDAKCFTVNGVVPLRAAVSFSGLLGFCNPLFTKLRLDPGVLVPNIHLTNCYNYHDGSILSHIPIVFL